MPQPITEHFGGGLVKREATFLGAGELARADDAYYRPNSPSPLPFPGRNKLTGQSSLAPVVIEGSTTTVTYTFDDMEWGFHSTGAAGKSRMTQANVQVAYDNDRAAGSTIVGKVTRLEGFEGGGDNTSSKLTMFQGTSGTAMGVQGTTVRTGSWAFRVAAPTLSTACGYLGVSWDADGDSNEYSGTDYDNILCSLYVAFTAFPSATDNPILSFHDTGSTLRGRLDITSGGLLKVQTGTPTTGSALSLSTWYRLDVWYSVSDGYLRVYLNGVLDIDVSTALATAIETVALGKSVSVADTYTCYYDDVLIQASDTNSELAIQGANDWGIKRLNAVADGTYDGTWGATTAPDAWDSVDDAPDNGDTNLVESTTAEDRQTFIHQESGDVTITGHVLAVQFTPVMRFQSAAAPGYLMARLPAGAGGTDYDLTTLTTLTATYRVYGWCGTVSPATTNWAVSTTTPTYTTTYPEMPAPLRYVSGVRFIQRETGTDLILVHANDEYLYGELSEDNVDFTVISESVPAGFGGISTTRTVEHLRGQLLEAAQVTTPSFGEQFVIANGVTPILVKDPTLPAGTGHTKLGLTQPNTPTAEATVLGGVALTEGYWWVWLTEYNSKLGVESCASDRVIVEVTAPNDGILVTFPEVVNDETDYWKVYFAGPTATNYDFDDPFPAGYRAYTGVPGTLIANATANISGAILNFSDPFPFITVRQNDQLIPWEISGSRIPNPTTVDMFQGCVVCNDKNNPTFICYSFPERPGAWPFPFYIAPETQVQDVPIKIRRVGNSLIVLMRNQVIRVNWLPRETDAEFNRGRVWDILSSNQGCVGPQAADLVSLDDSAPVLVFYSPSDGLYATDGQEVRAIEMDMDWAAEVGERDQICVRDFPRLQLLLVSYPTKDSSICNRSIALHYHSSHRKEGMLKVTGPITFGFRDACYAPSKNLDTPTLVTLDGQNQLWREERSTPPYPMHLLTRKLHTPFPTERVNLSRIWVRHGQSGTPGSCYVVTEAPDSAPEELPPVQLHMKDWTLSQVDVGRETHIFQVGLESMAELHYWIGEALETND